LVSRPFLAFGIMSGSEALVSRFLAFLAASMFSGSLAGGALAQLLSISLYCCVPTTLQACLSPSYPWTLIIRPRRTQLAWNAPGLASPSSLVRAGDQPGTQAAFPRFVAPLLYSSLRNVVNADLFFLLALQQACEEGIAYLHYPSCGCSVVPLHTGSPYSGCGLAWKIDA
jgi:hypothetical protein